MMAFFSFVYTLKLFKNKQIRLVFTYATGPIFIRFTFHDIVISVWYNRLLRVAMG